MNLVDESLIQEVWDRAKPFLDDVDASELRQDPMRRTIKRREYLNRDSVVAELWSNLVYG